MRDTDMNSTPEAFTFSSYKVFKEPVTVDWFSKKTLLLERTIQESPV